MLRAAPSLFRSSPILRLRWLADCPANCTQAETWWRYGNSSRGICPVTRSHGSVGQFVETLEKDLPAAVTADLRLEVSGNLTAVRTVDFEIIAMSALNRLQPLDADRVRRQSTLASSQTLSEASGYESAWVLARHGYQR